MSKLIRHIKRWNYWRKYNTNSWVHKLFVLVGISHSPTFLWTILPEEWETNYHEDKTC